VILCSGFPSQLLLIAVLHGFGVRAITAEGRFSPPFIFALSLADAVLVVGLVLLFLRAHHESARAVLLGSRSLLREAAIGVLLLPVILVLVVAVLLLILTMAPHLHNVTHNPLEEMLRTRRDAAIFAVVVMLAGGVREEVQRGFILHRFQQYLGGGAVGVVLYSVLFGFGHIEQGYDAVVATALLGAAWGVTYLARRSIVAPMVSHAGFNLAQLAKYLMVAATRS
jgi:membrane protease YdiL (CAAX protease family)